ncbi:MAG: LLM class F420-dependent oxidoreductase [Acidimicrobiales bacterium]
MKFGLMFANTGPFASAEGVVELATTAEAAGFESIWTVEHVIWPESYSSAYPYSPTGKMPGDSSAPLPDPLIWLSFAAAHTSTIRLATGILILPERNPLVLAKSVASLDVLSGGRLDLGIGVGWLQEEFEALKIPFEDRGPRTDDYVAAMRALWASDNATYDGEFAGFQNVTSNPKPVSGEVPIVVGGHSKAAARRAGRLGNGFFPGKGSVDQIGELVDIARQTAADGGRDPEAIEMTAGHPGLFGDDPVGAAEELASVGVSRSIVPAFMLVKGSTADKADALAEKILRPCASVG